MPEHSDELSDHASSYWRLTPEQSKVLMDALENPPSPNQRMRDAARRYLDRFIQWKGGR